MARDLKRQQARAAAYDREALADDPIVAELIHEAQTHACPMSLDDIREALRLEALRREGEQ